MSLRDDLDIMASCMEPVDGRPEAAYNRLRAALTPAAEKWLEALPELLELEKQATPAPWETEEATPNEHGFLTAWIYGDVFTHGEFYFQDKDYPESNPTEDAALVVELRNALHEAAALHNAQDNKEQK